MCSCEHGELNWFARGMLRKVKQNESVAEHVVTVDPTRAIHPAFVREYWQKEAKNFLELRDAVSGAADMLAEETVTTEGENKEEAKEHDQLLVQEQRHEAVNEISNSSEASRNQEELAQEMFAYVHRKQEIRARFPARNSQSVVVLNGAMAKVPLCPDLQR